MRFAVGGEQTARIAQRGLALSARKNPRRHLSFLGCEIARESNRARTIFRRKRGRCFDEAIHGLVPLLTRHREESRVSGLAVRQRERGLNRPAQGVFVQPIGRGPRRAAAGRGANRNRHAMLKNVLVDAIVRKPRERIRNLINMNFRL
jgi:hypothetical protein